MLLITDQRETLRFLIIKDIVKNLVTIVAVTTLQFSDPSNINSFQIKCRRYVHMAIKQYYTFQVYKPKVFSIDK